MTTFLHFRITLLLLILHGLFTGVAITDTESCTYLDRMRICSHQGNGADPAYNNNIINAMKALVLEGIACFDMDVVRTRDGRFLIGHPRRIVDAARLASTSPIHSVEASTLLELRHAGASAQKFPDLATFAWKLGEFLGERFNTSSNVSRAGSGSHVLDTFFLLLEFKGVVNDDDDAVNEVVAEIRRLAPTLTIPLVWRSVPKLNSMNNVTSSRASVSHGSHIGSVLNVRNSLPALEKNVTSYTAHGVLASGLGVNYDDSIKRAVRESRLPIVAWIVNDVGTFAEVVRLGSTVVVSDDPLRISRIRSFQLDECGNHSQKTCDAHGGSECIVGQHERTK